MARPSKYNWEAIKIAYEKGFDKDDIVKKFKVPKNILTNNINKHNWTVKCDVNADINEFNERVNEIAFNYSEHPDVEDLFIEKINTQAIDNELIENNRKLAKMLQGVIVSSRREINLKNIKAVSATLKDIEAMANPQATRPNIEVTQQTAHITPPEINIIRDS